MIIFEVFLDYYVFGEFGNRKDSLLRLFQGFGELDGLDFELKGSRGINLFDVYSLEDFDLGEIVWVKFGKRNDFVWFVRVIDLFREVLFMVCELLLLNSLCVMFYGLLLFKGKYLWVCIIIFYNVELYLKSNFIVMCIVFGRFLVLV